MCVYVGQAVTFAALLVNVCVCVRLLFKNARVSTETPLARLLHSFTAFRQGLGVEGARVVAWFSCDRGSAVSLCVTVCVYVVRTCDRRVSAVFASSERAGVGVGVCVDSWTHVRWCPGAVGAVDVSPNSCCPCRRQPQQQQRAAKQATSSTNKQAHTTTKTRAQMLPVYGEQAFNNLVDKSNNSSKCA